MAELVPASMASLVTRLYREPSVQDTLFELPRRKWYVPAADTQDLSVRLHGRPAGNASGPAAGPHTQMAQNLLLSYAAGGRILELKTVQVDDRLTIPRPCIDMTTVGYNVEWSQELRVEESLREYVAGAMLIEMFRRQSPYHGGALDGTAGDWLFDTSVGYDLKGIKSATVCHFLDGMRDPAAVFARLRDEIPEEFRAARDVEIPARLSDSITLSTFHGCPAAEIEGITEFLIGDRDFDVIVKMNPPTLGKDELEHLLHDVLGYTELRVNPQAYSAVISFDDAVALSERLTRFAARRGRCVGFKFSNTLEILNHRDFFDAGSKIMYLSGQPLHVLTLALTAKFRAAVGPDVPISFSAGIDQHNFAAAVACGFVPVTVSSDLLRPGGYGRLGAYLERLAVAMREREAHTVDEFILKRFGNEPEARRRAEARGGEDPAGPAQHDAVVRWAGLLNTRQAADEARAEPRYRADRNRATPKRIDSHLTTFDCITCDKCLPVCPNAANFTYPTPPVAFDYADLLVDAAGRATPGDPRHFAIDRPMQIACYADFCNECGNCDTFCPEYGGPYIEKPSFFGSLESWERAAPRDGFVVGRTTHGAWIRGRIKGQVYELHGVGMNAAGGAEDGTTNGAAKAADEYLFEDGIVSLRFAAGAWHPAEIRVIAPIDGEHRVDMWALHTMRHLLHGVCDERRVNQVNAAWALSEPRP